MSVKRMSVLAVLLVTLVLMAGCGSQGSDSQKSGLKVVTTFYPMYDFAKQVVGKQGEVAMLIDGEEPHDYEPSAKDIALVEEADVFIYNSDEMETWVGALVKNIDTKKTKVIVASQGIPLLKGGAAHHHDEAEHGHDEPEGTHGEGDYPLHLHGVAGHYHSGDRVTLAAHGPDNEQVARFRWSMLEEGKDTFEVLAETEAELSFTIETTTQVAVARLASDGRVIDQIEPVTLTVEHHGDQQEGHDHGEEDHHHEFDPHVWLDPVLAQTEVTTIADGLAEVDPDNAKRYLSNAEVYNQQLAELDQAYKGAFQKAQNRIFVTQHTAFAYLANRYELTQLGISGLSPELEPTPKELAVAETFIKEHQVTTIFTEAQASPKIAQTVAEATGANMAVLSPLENVSKVDREGGMDYIGVMKANLEALKLVIK